MTAAIWKAPSVESLSHQKIRLDCTPEVLRGVWRSQTKKECLRWLIEHFDGDEGKADDLFHTTSRDGYIRRSFGAHKRELVNSLAGFFGVLELGFHRRSWKFTYYLNAGETYAATLFFAGRRMFVSTMGYEVESRNYRDYEGETV